MVARGRFAHLFAQHFLGKVPAHGDDGCSPGDAGAAKEKGWPATVEIAAVRCKDVDLAPVAFAACLAVDAEARHAAHASEEKGGNAIEHGAGRTGARAGTDAAGQRSPDRPAAARAPLRGQRGRTVAGRDRPPRRSVAGAGGPGFGGFAGRGTPPTSGGSAATAGCGTGPTARRPGLRQPCPPGAVL